MGANFICHTLTGYTARDTFNPFRDDQAEKYGSDYYGGTFGSTNLGYVRTLTTGLCTKEIEKEAKSILDQAEDDEKSTTVKGLDLGIVGYDIITVKKVKPTNPSPAKYEMGYILYDSILEKKVLAKGKDKKEMENKLLEMALEYPEAILKKTHLLVSGTELVCELNVTTKRVTKKPTRSPKNAIIKEVHKYVFFGVVPA